MKLSRQRTVAGLLALFLMTITGCAGTPDEPNVEVAGDFGRRPQVAFDTPLKIEEPSSQIVIQGDGKTLETDDPVLLSYVALSAVTGKVVDETYAREPRNITLSADSGPLYEELVGLNEGTRLLDLSPGTVNRPEPVVMVYDVLYTQARGETVELPDEGKGLPKVTRDEEGYPHLEIPDVDPPSQMRVFTLIKGEGPQVQEGGLLTAHYASVSWETGKEFDSTWGEKLPPPAIPFTGLIPAWQEGLSGATVGSQMMIIAPPEDSFGSDTVVFIIDVLASTNPEGSSDE